MTPAQIKIAGSAAILLLLWLFERRALAAPVASVDLGDPTVTGPGADGFGGRDYGTAREYGPNAQRFASDPEMNRLIIESNAAIEAAGGAP